MNKHIVNLNKESFFAYLAFALMTLLIISSCDSRKPLTPAPFDKNEVNRIFDSLMEIAEKESGIKPIANLKKPQPIIDFVRSFSSPALFKMALEKAFMKNGYSYSKTLDKIAKGDGFTIIMDFDGGAEMIVLLAMPSKGLKRKEIDTIFSGQELKDFKSVLDVIDRYLCCPLPEDF